MLLFLFLFLFLFLLQVTSAPVAPRLTKL